jgi:hypothetical protein
MIRTGLGLWRLRYLREWVARDSPELGYRLAMQKHLHVLRSWKAPFRLPALPPGLCDGIFPIHFLTGEFHWHLTCFCLYSLVKAAPHQFQPVIHDDGSLKEEHRDELRRIIPSIRFVPRKDDEERLNAYLPPERFPSLYSMRSQLSLMRKLLDVHAGKSGRNVFVDSDVLFYREPDWLLNWLDRGSCPVYLQDYQDSYGYRPDTLRSVYGTALPARVNTGLCGFTSGEIDWERLEFLAEGLLQAEGINHFSEQALTAMLAAEMNGSAAPIEDYVVSPSRGEVGNPCAVMHHYVVPSRTWYYIQAIPRLVARTKS